ncbi:tyrosine-protein phosphatase non-receptor type substrate 1-like [Heptranchias perlo]|uniref:tyrosine-protein phosphatase non-receptor type substrate 1-like n=1 Tax=Heptranchias perlo TaxID=212740 RepID=UPI0035595DA4
MLTRSAQQLVLSLGILSTVTGNPKLHVGQFPEILNVTSGANATFYCTFSLAQAREKVQVCWWRDGEQRFLETKSDSRYQFEIRNKVSAAFHLLNVGVQDAGLYYCRVNNDGKAGNGTSTRLLVSAPPDPPQIVPTLFWKESSLFLRLACKAGGFHSKELSIDWLVNGAEIVTGIRKDIQPRPGGLFQVSGYLEESQPAQNGTVYTCRVSHPNSRVQAFYTYTSSAEERESDVLPWWIYVCMGSGVLLLLLLIITPILCKFCVSRGKGRKAEERRVQENQSMQRPANRMVYTAIDFTSTAKVKKPQHVDKRSACPHVPPRKQQRDGKAVYATPQFKQHQGRERGPPRT